MMIMINVATLLLSSSVSALITAAPPPPAVKNGYTYTPLNKTLFVARQTLGTVPSTATAAQIQAITAAAGGPGSINKVCISTFCQTHQNTCLASSDCVNAFKCVTDCGTKYDLTPQDTTVDLQKQNWECVNQCYMKSKSALFGALSLCAQSYGCIEQFSPVFAPVPTYIAAAPLTGLVGSWSIGAGISSAYDQYSLSTFSLTSLGDTQFNLTVGLGTKRVTSGSLTYLSDGIYYYRSLTAEGFWYNLGTSSDRNMMIIYYTAHNSLSNWYGGYILLRNGKTLDLKAQYEATSLSTAAFTVPPNAPTNGDIQNTIVADYNSCQNPTTDTCVSQNWVCCINQNDLDQQKYTCRPNTLTECAAYSASSSPTLQTSSSGSGSAGTNVYPINQITLADFRIL